MENPCHSPLAYGYWLYRSPFTPIYEVTPIQSDEDPAITRGKMDLNRKGSQVQRTIGRLVGIKSPVINPLDVTLHLEYELPGMSSVTVQWKVMRNASKATVVFRMNKENRWEPENVYLSLPFLRQDGELWVDKAGAALRPWRDQIPGTCMDYSSVQAGVAVIRDNGGLVIGMPDSPLVYLGDLEHRPRRLFDPHENVKPDELYSWIMNNFWETNFNAGLGGFYEFRYVLEWGKHLELPQQAFERCQSNVQGLTVVRI